VFTMEDVIFTSWRPADLPPNGFQENQTGIFEVLLSSEQMGRKQEAPSRVFLSQNPEMSLFA
jgi:hypothetical protein